MKRISLLLVVVATIYTSLGQIQSPEQFLGYKIGSRYTPHYQIVNYFQYVANAAPAMVKLQQYGVTNEHRPLYVAYISTPDNISNLENIRLNNLRLAHLTKDRVAAMENTPAVIWLSYNVHGNEPSSSEAAMLTLFALVDPANTATKAWMKNTLIIIDPCLNPDGRERYVNWFNSVTGKNLDAASIAREHKEPWPGGRTNHYNFDLNRDWAWQSQLESRERLAQYNLWMPQVHVDFHEQSYNNPYYFAPAAEPFQEVITKWQRDFQTAIGKNNAKYFDKNGWLYFTKERYDLLYPSYGDTYPIYNGSIGMTYEQGGGPSGGLGVKTNSGDTLTLYQRVLHHYTTGISTLEVSSMHAAELVKNFHEFFNNAAGGNIGDYKTYVVKNNEQDEDRISALKILLNKNEIQYGTASGAARGYNYLTKKEEAFSINTGDIVISSSQPKAALLKVLFEPQTKLTDSVTYDITAWALPYAYGLKTYAVKEKIVPVNLTESTFQNNTLVDGYGYILRWHGVLAARTVVGLLQQGVRLHFAEKPFASGKESFDRGSIIILKNGNEKFGDDFWPMIIKVCNKNKIRLTPVSSGLVDKGLDFGSPSVHALKAVRVAMLTGSQVHSNAAGEIWNFFDNELDYKISLIDADDFSRADLKDIDVLIMPDGEYDLFKDKDATEQLHQWISNGGKLIAIENAAAQISMQPWSAIHIKTDSMVSDSINKKDPYALVKSYENRNRSEVSGYIPGAIFKVDIDNTHPLMFGYPDYYYTLKTDTTVYKFINKNGWNTGIIKKDNKTEGFVGAKIMSKLKDGLLFGVQDMNQGTLICLADDVLFRDFWENGKLMFCNAIFFAGE